MSTGSMETQTRSSSSTMTEARVRNVLLEVHADLLNLVAAGLLDFDDCHKWRDDLLFMLEREAITSFQIQLKSPAHLPLALEYSVRADGSLRTSEKAGGIDYYSLPPGTKASLYVRFDVNRNTTSVWEYLMGRNWGNGQAVTGNGAHDRTYSSEGYGVARSRIGSWQ